MNDDGLEGFLCPACKKDLGDGARLILHYEEEHDESEKIIRFPIKEHHSLLVFIDIFDKAKQKLLKSDLLVKESYHDTSEENIESTVVRQDLGIVTSHTSYFKSVRDQQVDKSAVETNNLLIRLDRLINEMPSDPSKRKAFEREAIPWLSDNETTNCKLCGIKFSLTRRKHHCRLCGKILCSSCSKFLKFNNANKMVNPSYAIAYNNEAGNAAKNIRKESPSTSKTSPMHLAAADHIARRLSAASSNLNFRQAERILLTGLSKLKGDGSEVSVNSFYNQEGEPHLRVCSLCNELLDRRDKQTEQRTTKPLIVQIYDRLATLINDLNRQFSPYQEMSLALNRGESKYDLKAVKDVLSQIENSIQQIKYVLSKLNQLISEGSQPISSNQSDGYSNKLGSKLTDQEVSLIRSVLRFALTHVSDIAVRLIKLPEPEQYEKLRENFRMKLEASINQERALVAATIKTSTSYDTNFRNEDKRDRNIDIQRSKLPEEFYIDISTNGKDKIIRTYEEQILKIQKDIVAATIECKLDEVDILSKHLNELKLELSKMRAENYTKSSFTLINVNNVSDIRGSI